MDKYPTTKKTPNALLKKISPGQNIRFHGHYTFCGSRHPINLDAMVANLTLEEGWTRATNIVDPIRLPKCHGKLPDGNFGGLDLQPRIGVMACFARTVPVAMDISDTSFLTVRHRADSDAV